MSTKKRSNGESARRALINRRNFLYTVGAATATLPALTALSPDGEAAGLGEAAARGPGVLTHAPVVMIWRRVTNLYETQAFVGKGLNLPKVGQDPTSVMYDAGGALVGYSVHEVSSSGDPPTEPLCSEQGLAAYGLQHNPASSLVFAPSDYTGAVRKLYTTRGMVTPSVRNDYGERLSFLDEDGNYSSFYRPSNLAMEGRAGAKLSSLLRRRWSESVVADAGLNDKSRAAAPVPNPIIGVELLVSDLAKSKDFYAGVLGLEVLESNAGEVRFDAGPLILTLRAEPSNMLVQFLRRTGRLLGDWFVFHVNDIKGTTDALVNKGIKFPSGIERSVIGDVAYFNDPDGYSFNLWKPSGMTKMIDFTPALKRILKETSRAAP